MESPELSYYQSTVDDLRISNERIHEELDAIRREVTILRRIIATATLYLSSLNDENTLDEAALMLDLDRQIKQYQNYRKDNR